MNKSFLKSFILSCCFVFFFSCGPVDKWPVEHELKNITFSFLPDNSTWTTNDSAELTISFDNDIFDSYEIYITAYENLDTKKTSKIAIYEESDLDTDLNGQKQTFSLSSSQVYAKQYKVYANNKGDFVLHISIYGSGNTKDEDTYCVRKKYNMKILY